MENDLRRLSCGFVAAEMWLVYRGVLQKNIISIFRDEIAEIKESIVNRQGERSAPSNGDLQVLSV